MRARNIIAALGGNWFGSYGTAKCPAHSDATPSLSVSETGGTVLVHCHAGCSQDSVIAALSSRGMWSAQESGQALAVHTTDTAYQQLALQERLQRQRAAQALWSQAVAIYGTIAERYLTEARQIVLPAALESLRFLESCHHPSGVSCPALIAAVTLPDGTITAVQRTYLSGDGLSKAGLQPNKMTLGPMMDGAVKLETHDGTLGVAEGVETALSAAQLSQIPTWACLGAARMGKLTLPDGVKNIILFADSGEAGLNAAEYAKTIYRERGMQAVVAAPREHSDWNDVLRDKTAKAAWEYL